MGIRTKHFGASFEAGLEGLKAMEIGENNVTKKVPVLVLKTYEKAGAQKWASPVSHAKADAVVAAKVNWWRSIHSPTEEVQSLVSRIIIFSEA